MIEFKIHFSHLLQSDSNSNVMNMVQSGVP